VRIRFRDRVVIDMDTTREYSCIVVGAGLSGLYAAQQLKKFLPDVLVVEASSDIGGRVKQVRDTTELLTGSSLDCANA